MRLSDFESAIVAALKLDAELPLKTLADKLGKSVGTLRSAIAKLEDRGVLRFYPFINIYALGYSNYLYYFTPVSSQENNIIQMLSKNERVSWLVQFSGSYRYCASFVCASPSQFQEMLSSLGERFNVTCKCSCVQVQTALTMFPPKYLNPREHDMGSISWSSNASVVTIDKLDAKILTGLIQKKYSSLRDLARQIKVSHSTLAERVTRLRKNRVIERFVYTSSSKIYGYTSYRVLIRSKTLHPRFKSELFEFSRLHPQVTIMLECFGTWNFELSVEAREIKEVQSVIELLRTHFGKLIEIVEVLTMEDKLKDTCYPFAELV